MSEELKYAKDYWAYIKEIVSKYAGKNKGKENKHVIKSGGKSE